MALLDLFLEKSTSLSSENDNDNIIVGIINRAKDYLERVPEYRLPKELKIILKNNLSRRYSTGAFQKWFNFIKMLPNLHEIKEHGYFETLKDLLYLEEFYNSKSQAKKTLKVNLRHTKFRYHFDIKLRKLDEELSFLIPGAIIRIQKIGESGEIDKNAQKFYLKIIQVKDLFITVEADSGFIAQHKEDDTYILELKYSNWPTRVCQFAIDKMKEYNILNFMSPFTRKLQDPIGIHEGNKTHCLDLILNSSELNLEISLLIRIKRLESCLDWRQWPVGKIYDRGRISCPSAEISTDWFDKNIQKNPEQMQAVRQILNKTAYPSPFIVFGPPGTGKTTTIVEAVSQLSRSFRNKILICTPSNAAADEITKKLLKNNIPEDTIYRMMSPSVDLKNIDEVIFKCLNFDDDGDIAYLPMIKIMSKSIVISTLVASARLLRMGQLSNHFNYIFIDEAGQAKQPETFIPLALLKSHCESQIVMSGDPKQLGPVVLTKHGQHLLGTSMLERLMKYSELYKKGQDGKYDVNFLTKLVQNYRNHKQILKLPNEMFYGNELVACGTKEIDKFENWIHLPKKGFPIIFHAVHGNEERDEFHSVKNEAEATIVMDYVKKLLDENVDELKIDESNIGIITPFRHQTSIIKEALANKGLLEISVGTVEYFQGAERDVIIVSTVRSTVFKNNGKSHVGFLSNEKRFNVTITRAKFLLIVIGNPEVLQIDDSWRKFITFCRSNEACCGDSWPKPVKSLNLKQNSKTKHSFAKPKSVSSLENIILEKRMKALRIKKVKAKAKFPTAKKVQDLKS